jgi:hypothetical protein
MYNLDEEVSEGYTDYVSFCRHALQFDGFFFCFLDEGVAPGNA